MVEYLFSEIAVAVWLGSAFQEVLHWYGLRSKLHLKSMKAKLLSWPYWLMTILMMTFSVVGVYFWFDGQTASQSLRDMFIFGAAFPLIFKSVVKSVSQDQSAKLGAGSSELNVFDTSQFSSFFKVYFGD